MVKSKQLRISIELEKELEKIAKNISKTLGWKPTCPKTSKIIAGVISGKKVKIRKRRKKEWDIDLV